LNNRPVTALIDPLYPDAVVASQAIEGLIRPEWRGNSFAVPGVATNKSIATIACSPLFDPCYFRWRDSF
jgi:hypothetical protein